jgi:lysophospholipase L1-like esterase
VRVDACKPEILERRRAQRLKNTLRRVARLERAALDVVQQALQIVKVHIAYNPFLC